MDDHQTRVHGDLKTVEVDQRSITILSTIDDTNRFVLSYRKLLNFRTIVQPDDLCRPFFKPGLSIEN